MPVSCYISIFLLLPHFGSLLCRNEVLELSEVSTEFVENLSESVNDLSSVSLCLCASSQQLKKISSEVHKC